MTDASDQTGVNGEGESSDFTEKPARPVPVPSKRIVNHVIDTQPPPDGKPED